MSLTNAYENLILGHTVGGPDFPRIPVLWFGVSTTQPLEDGTGFTEPNGLGYTRIEVINDGAGKLWTSPSGGLVTNIRDVQFPVALGAWGTFPYWGLWTARVGGVLFWFGTFTIPRIVAEGDELLLRPGVLNLTAD